MHRRGWITEHHSDLPEECILLLYATWVGVWGVALAQCVVTPCFPSSEMLQEPAFTSLARVMAGERH